MDTIPDYIATAALERLAAMNEPATPDNFRRVYLEISGQPEPEPIVPLAIAPCAEMLSSVRNMVQNVIGTTDNLGGELNKGGESISKSVKQLKAAREKNEVVQLLSLILSQTSGIQSAVETSQKELLETRRSLEDMRRELVETRQLLNEDPLTGALNRRGLEQTLTREIARAERNQTKLCVAMIDLDHFKAINDTYGHEVGDQVLVHFSTITRAVMRQSDALVRYGGEEFALLLPETDMRGAHFVLGRLQMQVGKTPVLLDGKSISFTFSAGIAQLQDKEAGHAFLQRADKAMYSAKQGGRNCIKLSG